MNVTAEKKDLHTWVLEVSATPEEVEKAFKTATQRIANQVSIPGFRKGKAPRQILENRIGKEAFVEEAFEVLVGRTYPEALKQDDINPVARPEIEKVTFEEGQAATYKATVVAQPKIELGEYKGLQVEKPAVEVTDAQIEEHIEGLRTRQAQMIAAPEGSAAESGDMVLIDFTGSVDGVPFDGGTGKSYPLELGSGSFIPGFEDQVIGAKAGEERTVKVSFPEEYFVPELAGKEAEFEVTVQDIKRKELPEINDEFAKKVGNFETVEALKEDVRARLENAAKTDSERQYRASIIKKLVDSIEVELPQVMIDSRVNNMLAELDMNLQNRGANIDSYLQHSGKTIADLKADYEESARDGVKTDLVLEAVAKAENLGASQRDLDMEYRIMSMNYNVPIKNVKSYVEKEGQVGSLLMTIMRRKAAEVVISSAVVS